MEGNIDYKKMLLTEGVVVLEDVNDMFEFLCQLRDDIHYPTRAKITDVLRELIEQHRLNIEGNNIDEVEEMLDKFEEMLYTIVKR